MAFLHHACSCGDMEGAKRALGEGEDPNYRGGKRGMTCLMEAVCKGHASIVQLLLEQPGVDVAADLNGMTALHYASSKGREGMVMRLMKCLGPGKLNAKNSTGRTPLMLAVMYGELECARELAKEEAVELDTKDAEDRGLEEVAREQGVTYELEVLRLLQEARRHRDESKSLTCPVCYEEAKPPMRLKQCINGHIICDTCYTRIKREGRLKRRTGDNPFPYNDSCHSCRRRVSGRPTQLETLLGLN